MSVSPLLSIPNDEVLFQKHQLLPFTVANLHYQFISQKRGTDFIIFINIISSLTDLRSLLFFLKMIIFVSNPILCTHWKQFSCHWFALFVTMSSQCWEYLTDQKLVVQFDSKLTWEIELLISHGILEYLMITKPLKVVCLWWRLYKLSSHFIIDKKNFSSVTVCVEGRSVTQWFPAPKRQL